MQIENSTEDSKTAYTLQKSINGHCATHECCTQATLLCVCALRRSCLNITKSSRVLWYLNKQLPLQ